MFLLTKTKTSVSYNSVSINHNSAVVHKKINLFIFKYIRQKSRWGGKGLHYFVANLFKTLYSTFYQNQPAKFTEDRTKHFRLLFIGT